MKPEIHDYLKQNKYMTLATSNMQGKPEAATVEYALDGDSLLINTDIRYRKYRNLVENPQIACVITTNHDATLQFDGLIKQLEGEEADSAKQKLLKAEPDFAKFFSDENTRFFRVSPIWMRLRNYTKKPMQVIEQKFVA